jgi:purine-binding chemotaxis protein CheW
MNEPATAARILHERAVALARVPPVDSAAQGRLELLEFKLANERYALETRHVIEVHPLRELTPLPGTPAFIRGIVNLRGRILPVFDLKTFFGLPEYGVTDLHRIIVVRGNGLELGLLADVVAGVRSVAVESLSPPLPTLSQIAAVYLKGVSEERLVVLDLDRILADPKIVVDDEVDS